MIGVLTASDATAYCLANGGNAGDCAAQIASQTVNGVFCDGSVLLSLDAAGNHVSTCVPQAAIDTKIAAMKADCLANCGKTRTPALDAQCVPWCGGGAAYSAAFTSTPTGKLVLVAGTVASLATLAYVLLRK